MELETGLEGHAVMVVGENDTAAAQGSGGVPVLATPRVVALMEAAAIDCLKGRLPDGKTTVGTRVDIRHIAATPVGMKVEAVAKLTGLNGRSLTFEVTARDERETVATGHHDRYVVTTERFVEKSRAKLSPE
ncbi:MAG: thioesterase family protein [Peptococcaceae bacterium]|nr:thioesterase family protein [Peptococcaceae bacterium]